MARFSWDLSDRIKELRSMLGDYAHEPKILDPNDASMMVAALTMMLELARDLENEVSRLKWNEPALRDALAERLDSTDRLLAEVRRPGTNVKLFPVLARTLQGELPGGGAA